MLLMKKYKKYTIILIETYRSIATPHTSTMSNIPTGLTGGFVLYVGEWTSINPNNPYIRQEIISGTSTWIRTTSNGGSTWGSWYKLTISSV